MNFCILSDKGPGLSPPEPPPEKVWCSPACPGPRAASFGEAFLPGGLWSLWQGRAETPP